MTTEPGPPRPSTPPPFRLDALARFEGPAESRPFVLAGDGAAVLGEEAGGVREIHLHPVRAAVGLRSGLPPASRVEIAAGAARRHLEAGGTSLLESILISRRLPAAVLRWSLEGAGAGAGSFQLSLAWECPGAAMPAAGEGAAGEGSLRLPLPDAGAEVLFTLAGGTGRWRVEERDGPRGRSGIRVGVRAYLRPGRPLALTAALVRGDGSEAEAALSRLASPEAEIRAWAADEREGDVGLALEATDEAAARAVGWLRRRLRSSVIRPAGVRPGTVVRGYGSGCGTPSGVASGNGDDDRRALSAGAVETAWIGRGLLAAGLHGRALDATEWALERLAAREGEPRRGKPGSDSMLLHLAATYALWTGDDGPLARRPETIDAAADRIRERVEDADADAVEAVAAAAAFRALADALEPADPRGRSSELRHEWERLRSRLSGGEGPPSGPEAEAREPAAAVWEGRRLRLPVLPAPPGAGGPPGPGEGSLLPPADVLAAVLGVPGPPPRGDEGGGGVGTLEAALRAWALWERGDPGLALERWRASLAAGTEGGRGLWGRDAGLGRAAAVAAGARSPPGDLCPWHSATTALVLASLVFGMLGARADAAYGRLRLAPRVPESWDRFRITGLRVGDATVGLSYRRAGGRHTFVLAPTAGRVPLNVVFEPLLPVAEVGAVRVEGEPAEVDVRRSRGRSGVRLQLPLDSRREVTVEGADRPG